MAKKSFPFAKPVPVRFKHNHTVRDEMVSANKMVNYTKVTLVSGAVYPATHFELVTP